MVRLFFFKFLISSVQYFGIQWLCFNSLTFAVRNQTKNMDSHSGEFKASYINPFFFSGDNCLQQCQRADNQMWLLAMPDSTRYDGNVKFPAADRTPQLLQSFLVNKFACWMTVAKVNSMDLESLTLNIFCRYSLYASGWMLREVSSANISITSPTFMYLKPESIQLLKMPEHLHTLEVHLFEMQLGS